MDPRRLTLRVAAAALLTAAAAGCTPSPEEPVGEDGSETARVAWVVDGDTLRLDDGRVVRLLQIDAPEARADCWGRDATRALVRATPKGTRVTLVADPALDRVDDYGRLLRYVVVGGRDVNLDLVAQGDAAPYFFRGRRGRHAEALERAAREARAASRGFWRACPRARLEPGLGSVTGPASSERR